MNPNSYPSGRDPNLNRMLAAEDRTAERHGNPLLAAVGSAIVGGIFLAMVALALWGWIS